MNSYKLSFRIVFLFLLNFVFVVPSFAQYQEYNLNISEDAVIAQVDSIIITAEEFYLSYEFGPAFVKRIEGSKEKHLQYLINEKLLALDGYSRNIDTNNQIIQNINTFNADLATEEMYKDKIFNTINNTEPEIDSVITEKQIEVSVKWLFSNSDATIGTYLNNLKSGVSFDSLYNAQLSSSVTPSDRSLNTTRYSIGKKNPALASIIDTMKAKTFSAPIHINDGWYILYLENFSQNNLISETEHTRLREESIRAVTKRKMDNISTKYIDSLMKSNDPMVINTTYTILRSYIGKFILEDKLYNNWYLGQKLQETLDELNITDPKKMNSLELVKLKDGSVSIKQFLEWFWLRDQYVKFNKNSLQKYSQSLNEIIYQMVRDVLLTQQAYAEGYQYNQNVQRQIRWWKDKILSSAVKSEIKSAVLLDNKEVDITKTENESELEKMESEYMLRLSQKLNKLKQIYKVEISKDVLKKVSVSEENNKKAIDFYSVKKGGLIPRTPYPTIDFEWSGWE